MGENLNEKCAVAAVSLHDKNNHPKGQAAFYLYKMLLQQQHRGQLSAGITTFNKDRRQLIDTYKKLGKVNDVFRTFRTEKFNGIMEKYSGSKGIGHLRYATSGNDAVSLAQPFERHHGRIWKWFAFAFNGTIANYPQLKSQLEDSKYQLVHETDTEVMLHLLSKAMGGTKKPNMQKLFSNVASFLDGSYSLVFLNAEGKIAIVRDPHGFRPLSYIVRDNDFFAASESVAFSWDTGCKLNDVKPGELITFSEGSIEKQSFIEPEKKSHCMFEWVYFSSPASTLEGRVVYDVRRALGKELAKIEPLENRDNTVVVPVPDTSRPAGDSLAYELGIPSQEGLMRNRYIGRTFIEGNNRAERVNEKYSLIKSVFKNKRVILVEDSIVRGTTLKGLVHRIKDYGKAKEVHLRVSCPPILAPCFYGIAMPTISELIAPKFVSDTEAGITEKEQGAIADYFGLDSLVYLPREKLPDAIGLPKNDLCMACLNGDYPTECGKALYCKALRESQKKKQLAKE